MRLNALLGKLAIVSPQKSMGITYPKPQKNSEIRFSKDGPNIDNAWAVLGLLLALGGSLTGAIGGGLALLQESNTSIAHARKTIETSVTQRQEALKTTGESNPQIQQNFAAHFQTILQETARLTNNTQVADFLKKNTPLNPAEVQASLQAIQNIDNHAEAFKNPQALLNIWFTQTFSQKTNVATAEACKLEVAKLLNEVDSNADTVRILKAVLIASLVVFGTTASFLAYDEVKNGKPDRIRRKQVKEFMERQNKTRLSNPH